MRAAVNQVFRPGGGDLTKESPLLFDAANRENLRVIVGGDESGNPRANEGIGAPALGQRIVAHAGYVIREALVFRRRIQIACVGAVFTAPAEREKGLASRVLADVLVHARRGTDLVLCSGDRDLYRRQGLDPVPPLARFRLPSGVTATAENHVRDATLDDLETLAALYDAEAVHFIRTRDDWRRIWDAGLLVDAPGHDFDRQPGRSDRRIRRHPEGDPLRGRIDTPPSNPRGGGRSHRGCRSGTVVGRGAAGPPYDASTIALCGGKGWIRTSRQFLVTAEALTADVQVIPWYGFNYL